ncbi:hypothetical protein [Cellulosimicrobium funkei]|uniref:hypothetical protein n=1 Tax=Cellulosimicrobium funkei TaxID=264251 RepID=UPI0036C1DB53
MVKKYVYQVSEPAAGQLETWARRQPMLEVQVVQTYYSQMLRTAVLTIAIKAPDDAPLPPPSQDPHAITGQWHTEPWSPGVRGYHPHWPDEEVAALQVEFDRNVQQWDEYASRWAPPSRTPWWKPSIGHRRTTRPAD